MDYSFLTDKTEIENWLNAMDVKNYHIQKSGIVHVDGKVRLFKKELTHIPVQFGEVKGDFSCQGNQLTSLRGSPSIVGESFICCYNQLTSLDYLPQEIGEGLHIENNQITELKNIPKIIYGAFECWHNQLTSLKGSPEKIHGDFKCSENLLTSLHDGPQLVYGDYNCAHNQLTTIEGVAREIHGQFYCLRNKIKTINKSHLPIYLKDDFRIMQDEKIINLLPLYRKIEYFTGEWIDLRLDELKDYFFAMELEHKLAFKGAKNIRSKI